MTEVNAPKKRQRLRRGLAGLSGVAVLATSLVGVGMPSAVAAPETFNPFSINSGFTVLTTGDAELGNAELEGSIAAYGSISTPKSNYPVVHKVAGLDDYTVPSIDGKPVRILANKFVGTGNFDLSNAGAPDASAPEANAVAKLVDVSNVTASQRGDFVRLQNSEGQGVLDLKSLKYTEYVPSDYTAQLTSVEAYFPGVSAHVAKTNQCLASLQAPDTTAANFVNVTNDGGMAYVEGFATDKPNLINYADVAGKTVKLDRAGGYKPTAQAPLVVKLPAGSTSLGKLNFEGWNASAGADQVLSRYILVDASEVTGTLSVDGFEMGAIWAPAAVIDFKADITTNGQWFSSGVLTAGSGEVHHHTFLGVLPCVTATEPVLEPSIGTTVAVDGSDVKVLPLTGGTVVDTVAYEDLTPGVEYTLEGELFVAATGEATGLKASATFTPTESNGSTTVTFTLSADDVAAYAGQDLVVFEYLTAAGEEVAEHTDLQDAAQTFSVEEAPVVVLEPSIGTTVAVDGSDVKVLPLTGGTVVDTVAFEGLTVGTEYVLTGQVMTVPGGVETGITATKTFTAEAAEGTVDVTFTISAEQALEFAGQSLVVFEYLTAAGEEVAEHTDLQDAAQTFSVEEAPVVVLEPSIGTTVAVDGSDVKVLPLTGGTVVDTVAYEDLTPGVEYTLEGELFVAATGVSTGLTASATFTPAESSGSTTVEFVLTAEQVAAYAGQDLVVFEYLSLDGELVAEHADLDDAAQTFSVEEAPGGETPGEPGEETPGEPGEKTPEYPRDSEEPGLAVTGTQVAYVTGAAALLLVAGISLLMMRRRRA